MNHVYQGHTIMKGNLKHIKSRALLFPVHGQRRSQPFHRCEFQAWCVCGRVAYVEMDLPIYLSICIWTYVFILIRTCIHTVFICWTFCCVQRHLPHHPTRNVLGMCFWKPCRSYILHGFCLMLNIHYDGFHGWNRPQKCLHSLLHLNRFQIHIHFVWGHNVFQTLIFMLLGYL